MLSIVILFSLPLIAGEPDTTLLSQFLRTDFQVVNTNDSLMIGVGTEEAMANPGAPFNVTDVVDDANLPFQRLGFYGQSDSLRFVYYEQGGIGHSWNLVLFTPMRDSFNTLGAYWLIFDPVKDINQLKALIQRCRVVSVGQRWSREEDENLIVIVPRSDHQVYIRRR